MLNQEYDVLIVGARVGGSIAASLLGDAGYRVLLVDRAAFPSSTLSTHFFRGGGMGTVLKRLGVLEQVLELGCPPLVCQYNYLDGAVQPVVNPPQTPGEVGYALSVRREPLDYILLQRALLSPTVHFFGQTHVKELVWEGERVVGAYLATADGDLSVRARIVVGADGRHSFIARAVHAPIEETAPPYRAIYHCYVRGFSGPGGVEPNGPEFSRFGDENAYIFPSDDGVTCVALSINLVDFAWMRKAAPERFRERLARHRGLWDRFNASTPIERLLGCGPEPSYVRVPVGCGWALVGDASMHQDAWSGFGMDMASTHATFLAEALIAWLDNRMSERDALDSYHQRRNEHGLAVYRRTTQLASDLRQIVPQ